MRKEIGFCKLKTIANYSIGIEYSAPITYIDINFRVSHSKDKLTNIKILKFNIEYFIPIELLDIKPNVLAYELPRPSNVNISNWHSFMTYSTPIIYDKENTTLRDFFYSYEETSLFGLDCLYRINGVMFKHNYIPTLHSVYLEIDNDKEVVYSNDSTLDMSHLSNISDDNITKGNNFILYNEDKKHYQRKTMISKIDDILNMNDLNEISLNKIKDSSWFGIEWNTGKNTSNTNQFIEITGKNSFISFYKFRTENFSETLKSLPLIGCIMSQNNNDMFWFTNQSVYINNAVDFNFNRQLYYTYMVKLVLILE